MSLIVSSDNQHLLFCSVLSILALIKLVLMALLCAAMKNYIQILIIPIIIISFLSSLSHQCARVLFSYSLNDNKSPRIFTTMLSILATFSNAVVPICLPISNSFCLLFRPLGAVASVPIKIGFAVTLIFYKFLNSLARSKYFFFFAFFDFHSVVCWGR